MLKEMTIMKDTYTSHKHNHSRERERDSNYVTFKGGWLEVEEGWTLAFLYAPPVAELVLLWKGAKIKKNKIKITCLGNM